MEILQFGENIKHLREIDGLKITEMLAEVGFPRSTWNGYENGSSFPSFKDLIKISDYFGILESDLLRAEIPESDLLELYNTYIIKQEDQKNIGNTPRSKSFKSHFNDIKTSLPLSANDTSVHENVQKPVQFAGKRLPKAYITPDQDTPENSFVLNESTTEYTATPKPSFEARLTALEATVLAFKDILGHYNPQK